MDENNSKEDRTSDETKNVVVDGVSPVEPTTHGIPIQAELNLMGDKASIVSIALLLSYIRFYLNTGKQGNITVKIGYNKPPSMPFNFTLNDELLDDIYPGDTIELN